MIHPVCALRDAKLNAFCNPFIMNSKSDAIIGFTSLANDPQSPVGKHPEDFALFHIANWNSETALYQNLPQPDQLLQALNCKEN